jgi:hypothetical protein
VVFGQEVLGGSRSEETANHSPLGPGGPEISGRMADDVPHISRREIENPNVGLTGASRNKGQRLSIWRQRPLIIECRIVRESFELRSISTNTVLKKFATRRNRNFEPLGVVCIFTIVVALFWWGWRRFSQMTPRRTSLAVGE